MSDIEVLNNKVDTCLQRIKMIEDQLGILIDHVEILSKTLVQQPSSQKRCIIAVTACPKQDNNKVVIGVAIFVPRQPVSKNIFDVSGGQYRGELLAIRAGLQQCNFIKLDNGISILYTYKDLLKDNSQDELAQIVIPAAYKMNSQFHYIDDPTNNKYLAELVTEVRKLAANNP